MPARTRTIAQVSGTVSKMILDMKFLKGFHKHTKKIKIVATTFDDDDNDDEDDDDDEGD